MKKSILIRLMSAFLVVVVLLSCESSTQKVKDAQDDVVEAKEELNEANKELDKANEKHLEDVEAYRKVIAEKIEANNQQIIVLKERIAKKDKITKEDFKKRVDEVEEKNRLLLEKLNNYKMNGKSNWEVFKIEFNRDMDELGKAFKDLSVKNVK
jgi:chromosome segregation ATPase